MDDFPLSPGPMRQLTPGDGSQEKSWIDLKWLIWILRIRAIVFPVKSSLLDFRQCRTEKGGSFRSSQSYYASQQATTDPGRRTRPRPRVLRLNVFIKARDWPAAASWLAR